MTYAVAAVALAVAVAFIHPAVIKAQQSNYMGTMVGKVS